VVRYLKFKQSLSLEHVIFHISFTRS
jgi:hypothetical protein